MSGSRPQHLQLRHGTFHLRLRVPDDLKALVGLSEVRRSLNAHTLSVARPLALKYAARLMETFDMLREQNLSPSSRRGKSHAARFRRTRSSRCSVRRSSLGASPSSGASNPVTKSSGMTAIGYPFIASRQMGDDEMSLKQTLRIAREALAEDLRDREPPKRCPLSADPLLCGSVMRFGIKRGLTDLALRAASTLAVFDPDRLWLELNTAIVEDFGPAGFDILTGALASQADVAWMRRNGGLWPVVSHHVQIACDCPKSRSGMALSALKSQFRYLWKIGQDLNPELARVVEIATDLRVPKSATEAATLPRRAAVLELLSETTPWSILDVAELAWKRTKSEAAFPAACLWSSYDTGPTHVRQFDLGPFDMMGDIPIPALTHRTPIGRRLIWQRIESRQGINGSMSVSAGALDEAIMREGEAEARVWFDPVSSESVWRLALEVSEASAALIGLE
jgi:hypothetical protein